MNVTVNGLPQPSTLSCVKLRADPVFTAIDLVVVSAQPNASYAISKILKLPIVAKLWLVGELFCNALLSLKNHCTLNGAGVALPSNKVAELAQTVSGAVIKNGTNPAPAFT